MNGVICSNNYLIERQKINSNMNSTKNLNNFKELTRLIVRLTFKIAQTNLKNHLKNIFEPKGKLIHRPS